MHAPVLPSRRMFPESRATRAFLPLFDFLPKLDYSQFIMKKKKKKKKKTGFRFNRSELIYLSLLIESLCVFTYTTQLFRRMFLPRLL